MVLISLNSDLQVRYLFFKCIFKGTLCRIFLKKVIPLSHHLTTDWKRVAVFICLYFLIFTVECRTLKRGSSEVQQGSKRKLGNLQPHGRKNTNIARFNTNQTKSGLAFTLLYAFTNSNQQFLHSIPLMYLFQ